jgi:hypothetical protein
MEDFDAERRKTGALERHIQTFVQAALLAVLFWIGNTVVDVRDRVNRMEEKNASFAATVEELKASANRNMDDRWRGADHRAYAAQVDKELLVRDQRVDRLEARVAILERECERRRNLR